VNDIPSIIHKTRIAFVVAGPPNENITSRRDLVAAIAWRRNANWIPLYFSHEFPLRLLYKTHAMLYRLGIKSKLQQYLNT